MVMTWSAFLAAFLASLVEFVEALTIVLAVGAVRGWRPALTGAAAAAVVLTVLIALAGPHLLHLDIPAFKLVVGTLLLLFGLRWLRKAILRAAGVLALHDEGKIYARETAALQDGAGSNNDFGAAMTAFNGVFIEGLEVIFIVLAVGAGGGRSHLVQASMGAGASALLVVALGLAARQPLTQVPENLLKLIVGVLISTFGTFWVGEGLRLSWPGGDWVTLMLALAYFAVAAFGIALVKQTDAGFGDSEMNFLRTAVAEILGLFVDDWGFALSLIAWIGLMTVLVSRLPSRDTAVLLFAGLAALTLAFTVRQARHLRSKK